MITFNHSESLNGRKRVVAVFVSGYEWQFKDWPHNKKIVELFLRVRGYYIYYNDQQLPELTTKWNIKLLPLHRHKRH